MELLKNYALSMVGVPYIWGGSNPIQGSGVDCSGFVQLVLAAAGIDPPNDQTAQGLYDALEDDSAHNVRGAGSIAFFGRSILKISHVGFCLDPYRMIHAAGGDSSCKTPKDAIAKNAFVKITLIDYRSDLVAIIKPKYSKIGIA